MLPAHLWFPLFALLGVLASSALAEEPSPSTMTFETHIRPIFKAYCFQCHGEEQELAGGLDLRLSKLIARGGDSGGVFTAGDSADSLLIEYIESGIMPPQDDQQLSKPEIELIKRWIDAGAPAGAEPDEMPAPGEFFVTEQERMHWAFQQIVKAEIPSVDGEGMAGGNPVDAFVARKLLDHGLSFSPEADSVALIRRATFDLLGIPPTPQEVEMFVSDTSPNAYEKLIDRLLESPQYGERWGRHWLDVAGYADSEGYTDDDPVRVDAWMYRDYVIRCLNADKPWDQFIMEQLAGDELVKATHASAQARANADDDVREKLTATGFLRMAPDGTGGKPMDPELARDETITETLNIVSSALLGMTIGCAQCHDHRFDPIPQADFYRLRAVFAPVFDTTNWRTPSARRAALLSAEDRQQAGELEKRAKDLSDEHDRIKEETVQIVYQRILEDIPEQDREAAAEAFQTPRVQRTDEHKLFLEDNYPMLANLVAGRLHLYLARYKDGSALTAKYEKFLQEANKIRSQKPAPDYIRVATEDTQHVPTTHLFYRGDLHSPAADAVPPGNGLSVLADRVETTIAENDPSLPTTGRRLAFARSLVGGKHPLVPRVLVNRFWMHHFGQALVDTPGDFGLRASPPSHPELLDWLAADFVENGWHLKRFHKLVMTSRTYRQSSSRREDAQQIDADNRLLWRMPIRRLESEAVRDAILAISGGLQAEPYGPPVSVSVDDGGLVTVQDNGGGWKRSLYVQYRRTQPVYLLEAFDNPNMEPNCENRVASTVATQSLTMLNDPFIVQQAGLLADRVDRESEADASLTDRIRLAWRLAFHRDPEVGELAILSQYLQRQREDFHQRKIKNPEQVALASLCQVIFGTNEFLYIK